MARALFSEKSEPSGAKSKPSKFSGVGHAIRSCLKDTAYILSGRCSLVDYVFRDFADFERDVFAISVLRALLRTVVHLLVFYLRIFIVPFLRSDPPFTLNRICKNARKCHHERFLPFNTATTVFMAVTYPFPMAIRTLQRWITSAQYDPKLFELVNTNTAANSTAHYVSVNILLICEVFILCVATL